MQVHCDWVVMMMGPASLSIRTPLFSSIKVFSRFFFPPLAAREQCGSVVYGVRARASATVLLQWGKNKQASKTGCRHSCHVFGFGVGGGGYLAVHGCAPQHTVYALGKLSTVETALIKYHARAVTHSDSFFILRTHTVKEFFFQIILALLQTHCIGFHCARLLSCHPGAPAGETQCPRCSRGAALS